MLLKNNVKNYNIGLYIRLSREDDDKLYESESIVNQRNLLLQFVEENNYNLVDIYIDDGYSGTNFNRPAFKRMISDIEKKKINTVITKDMSRLGRDYIETGNLIERWFPEHGVRYIAVTDNIDTEFDYINNDIAPFKAIMNDMYAKDISKKIKSSLMAKRKQGEYIAARPPFGYKLDPNNKKHLIIDYEKAFVVKRIYSMALNGNTLFKIAKILTNEKIKTPADYYQFKWCNKKHIKGRWNSKTIKDILSNPIYTGDMVQYRRKKINYKINKVVKTNPKEYIIVKNTHEKIIDYETFEIVRKMLPKNVGRQEKKEHHLFDGLLYCAECGHRISVSSRRKIDNNCYTCCNYYRTYRGVNICSGHCNNYDKLENILLKTIREECKKEINIEQITQNINKLKINLKEDKNKIQITLLEKEIKNIKEKIDELYMDKLNKIINEEIFIKIKNKLESEIKIKNNQINKLNNNMNKQKNIFDYTNKVNKYVNDFLSLEKISRELIVALVDKVEIFEDKRINIIFSFSK